MTKPALWVVTTYLPPIDPMQCVLGPSFSRTHFPKIAEQIMKHKEPMFPCIDLMLTGANCFSQGPGGSIFWVEASIAEPNLYRMVAGKHPMNENQQLSYWMSEGSRIELVIDHICNQGKYNRAIRKLDDLYDIKRVMYLTDPNKDTQSPCRDGDDLLYW